EGGWARYESTEVVPYEKDIAGGIALLNEAMKKRDPGAYLYVSKLYREGKVVEKDTEKSAEFISKAAEYTVKTNVTAVQRVQAVIDDMVAKGEIGASKAAEAEDRLNSK